MFLVLEIQKNNEGQISTLVTQFEDIRAAKSKYHAVLSVAAVSGLPRHGAALIREDGYSLYHESYNNGFDDTTLYEDKEE